MFLSLRRFAMFAIVIGWLVFAEWPDLPTASGAAIIVGSGLYTFVRARARGAVPAI